MKAIHGILALSLALVSPLPGGWAQAASAAPGTTPGSAQSAPKSFRLLWTVREMDGGKPVSTQHYAMVAVPGGRTMVKLGSKVPVVTGSYTPGSAGTQTQFTYLDVGLNIDATLDQGSDGMKLRSKVEQSSVAEDKSSVDVREPIIRQTQLEGTSTVILNKPLVLGSLDIPGSSRHLDIEVTVERVQ